jgi:hypothetical protein
MRKDVQTARDTEEGIRPESASISLRLVPTSEPWRAVTATWIRAEELPILRAVAYALGPDTLRRARVAFTARGAFLRHEAGIEGIPVGEFFREIHPGLYIPAGYDAVPAVAPEVLHRALGAPAGQVIFVARSGEAVGVGADAFVPLESALLEAQRWAPLAGQPIDVEAGLSTALPDVVLPAVGIRPLRDVAPLAGEGGEAGARGVAVPETGEA